MTKFNQLIKHYGKFIVLFVSTLLVLAGCAYPMRNFGFSEISYTTGGGEEATSVSVQDFEIMLNSTIKSENNPQETNSMLKTRLQEQLLAMNLNPVTAGNAAYHLGGQLEVSEKRSSNGLIVPGAIFGIGLMPISLFFLPYIPWNDINYKTLTDINLLHVDSGKVILSKTIEKEDKIKASDRETFGVKAPSAKSNKALVRNIDRAIEEIADEISQAILEDKMASSVNSNGQ
ncbi:MAG: hypothetical protein JRD93_14280 [Deltaproteobacteria bacterium]|nr:hypothetical protein [Deltaproteobacteria bacterium]